VGGRSDWQENNCLSIFYPLWLSVVNQAIKHDSAGHTIILQCNVVTLQLHAHQLANQAS
jgi:hypothetical protein